MPASGKAFGEQELQRNMRYVEDPRQSRLLDPFGRVISAADMPVIADGWQGVLRHCFLERASTRDLYSMAGLVCLADFFNWNSEDASEKYMFLRSAIANFFDLNRRLTKKPPFTARLLSDNVSRGFNVEKMMRLIRILAVVSALCAGLLATWAIADQSPPAAGYRKLTLPAEGVRTRKCEVFLWYPSNTPAKTHNYHTQFGEVAVEGAVCPGRHPVILFSHGFHGTGDQSIFLMEAWARSGYIVAAPNHADAGLRPSGPQERPNFLNDKSWDDNKYHDRRDDLNDVLQHLLAEDQTSGGPLEGRVDVDAVGAAGHSLGGYTVLGLAGAWKSWKNDKVKAALAMSPYAMPYLRDDRLKQIAIPVMLQGGTHDWGISPFLPKAYDLLPMTKYHVVFKNENHFGWTNLASLGKKTTETVTSGNPELITTYSTAFFHRHLQRTAAQPLLEDKNSRVQTYQFSVIPPQP